MNEICLNKGLNVFYR